MHSPASAQDLRIALLFAAIAAVLVAGGVLSRIVRQIRQPAVIGEIAAGILLGPSVLGLLPGDLPHRLFPDGIRPLLSAIAQVGLMLFMFLVGWEFERSMLRRGKGAAVAISLSSVIVAFALGAGLGLLLHERHGIVRGNPVPVTVFCLFLGAAMSVTAFPVLARIISDNGIIHSRVASIALAGAAVDDVIAWTLLAGVSALVSAGSGGDLARIGVMAALYLVAMFVVVRPLLAVLVRAGTRGEHVSPFLLTTLAAGVFLSSAATTWIGIHAIFGAFLFGFVMPREPAEVLAVHLRRPLDSASVVLLPLFFIVTGLSVDVGGLKARDYLELVAVLACACLGKLVGACVPAKAFAMSWPEVRAIGLLMNTRGLTELIMLDAGLHLGILDGQLFTIMVLMGLITTAAAAPLLPRQFGGPPLRARTPLRVPLDLIRSPR